MKHTNVQKSIDIEPKQDYSGNKTVSKFYFFCETFLSWIFISNEIHYPNPMMTLTDILILFAPHYETNPVFPCFERCDKKHAKALVKYD